MTTGSLNRSATSVQLLGGAVGLFGLTAVMATIAQTVSRVDLHSPNPAAFRLLGLRLTAPTANVSGLILLLLAAAGTGILLAGLRSAWRLERARRRLLRSLRTTRSRLGEAGAIVFEDPRPRAFCMGYVRPRIYVSDGALGSSTATEMCAVLAHEDEHRRRRDPLRLACARVLCDSLFFLPVLRALRDRDAALAELLADDAAVAACSGDPAPLAAAMLTFGADAHGTAVGIAPERVDRLMGDHSNWRAPVLLAGTSLLGLAALAVATWQMGRAALVETTLNLPLLSSRPCIVVLACLPLVAVAVALSLLRRVA